MADKPLTEKMQAFVAAYGKNAGNGAASYREAYDTSRMDDATVRKRAAELLKHPGVKAAIAALRAAAAEKAEVDVAYVMRNLVENVEIAMARKRIKVRAQRRDRETGDIEVIENEVTDRDGNVAAKSLDLLAKMVGAYEVDHQQAAKAIAEATADNQTSSRDLARAVLSILRQAKIEDGAPTAGVADEEAEDEPEEEVDPQVSATPAAPTPASAAPVSTPPVSQPNSDRLANSGNEVLPNGAQIVYVAEFSKYGVYDGAGRLHSYKRKLEEARELAARIKPVVVEEDNR
jgi:Terminase small subunit